MTPASAGLFIQNCRQGRRRPTDGPGQLVPALPQRGLLPLRRSECSPRALRLAMAGTGRADASEPCQGQCRPGPPFAVSGGLVPLGATSRIEKRPCAGAWTAQNGPAQAWRKHFSHPQSKPHSEMVAISPVRRKREDLIDAECRRCAEKMLVRSFQSFAGGAAGGRPGAVPRLWLRGRLGDAGRPVTKSPGSH